MSLLLLSFLSLPIDKRRKFSLFRSTSSLNPLWNSTMSSVISPQSVILAAAMAVSGAVVFLSLYRQKTSPTNPLPGAPHLHSSKQPLRSCLSSVGKRDERDKKTKKKKKRVQFSDDVMATRRKTENFKREKKSMRIDKSCRTEIRRMPANRVALYNGILRDRIHRIECS